MRAQGRREQEKKGLTKREAAEQLRSRVTCAFAPGGRHWITVTLDDFDRVLCMDAECSGADLVAGETIARVGGQHCSTILTGLRQRLLSNDYRHDAPDEAESLFNIIERARTNRQTTNRERENERTFFDQFAGSKTRNEMFDALATRHGSNLAGFKIKVRTVEPSQAREIFLVKEDGRVSLENPVAGRSFPGGKPHWQMYEKNTRELLAPGRREGCQYVVHKGVCHACRDGAGKPKLYKDPTSHARSKFHADNVIMRLHKVVRLLSGRGLRSASGGSNPRSF